MNNQEKLTIGNQLKKLGESVNAQMFEFLKWQNVNLDLKSWLAIKIISKSKPVSVKQLAETLNITHPAVVQLVNQLVKYGYLESEKRDDDRRNTYFKLTAVGNKIFNKLNPGMSEAENLLVKKLGETGYDIDDVIKRLDLILSQKQVFNLSVGLVKSKQINEVRIIPFQKKYRQYFNELNKEWLEKYFDIEPSDEKILSNPEKEIINKGGEIFFALLGEEVVGTCAIIKLDAATFELAKMAVTEKAKGKQVGKKLGLTAIGYAVANNAIKIVLDTNSKLDAAVNLYRSLGFLVVPYQYDDKYKRELFRMELNLKEL